jgi:hypothetical protein
MPKVRYDDGLVINFDSTPSYQEIEEAYAQVKGSSTSTEKLLPKRYAKFIKGYARKC